LRIAVTVDVLDGKRFTGVEYYTYHLVRGLLHRSTHHITLIGTSRTPRYIFPSEVDFRVYHPLRPAGVGLLSDLFRPLAFLDEFDVVHCPTVKGPFFFRPRGKVVMTVHDVIPVIHPQWHILRRRIYFRYVLKCRFPFVDQFIATSHNTRRDLLAHYRVPGDRVEVVYEGVDEKFRPAPVPKRDILCVGTLEPRKSFRAVIEVFVELVARFGISENLVVVGKPGWYFRDLFRVPSGYEHRIRFAGYVSEEELIRLYQRAKLFVYPSFYEGFGLPVLEAMACGCPVVTSNVSSLPEVAGDAAILVNPKDKAQLLQAMYRVLNDPELRDRMARAGLARAAQFSWNRCAEMTLEVYEKAVCR